MENFKTSNFDVEELNTKQAAKINGGCMWCKVAKWAWKGITALNIAEQIQDGYQKCNDV